MIILPKFGTKLKPKTYQRLLIMTSDQKGIATPLRITTHNITFTITTETTTTLRP